MVFCVFVTLISGLIATFWARGCPLVGIFSVIRVDGIGYQHFLRELSIMMHFLAQEILPHDPSPRGWFLFFFNYTRDGNILSHLGFVFMVSGHITLTWAHVGPFARPYREGLGQGDRPGSSKTKAVKWQEVHFSSKHHDSRVWKNKTCFLVLTASLT